VSRRHPVIRTAATAFLLVTAFVATLAVGASPAGAHAIVEIQDTDAVVGRTSAMTLEIQHGCITGGGRTVGVVATFAPSFGTVTAGTVPGWSSAVIPGTAGAAAGGSTVTWTTTSAPQPFSAPLRLPLTVRWPKQPGSYGIAVSQTCSDPTEETVWATPVRPATVGVPSPPVTPLATVCVLPKRLAGTASTGRSAAIRKVCAIER